jgi:putative ABC transport system permease protein
MTLAPRWSKVVRDLGEHPVRCVLAVLAMTAGAFGVATIVTSSTILTRELKTTFEGTTPASAVLAVERLDAPTLAAVRAMPDVADAEVRPAVSARIRLANGDARSMTLFLVDGNRIDRITSSECAGKAIADCLAALQPDEILVERASMPVAHAAIGDRLVVKTRDGVAHSLRIAGTVHAAGLAPGWMDHHVSAFAGTRSLLHTDRARLLIVVRGDRLNEPHIREAAANVRALVERRGATVVDIEVPRPGRHPHADQMDTFLFLLGCFGVLTLALSAVLVATIIHALLTEQLRQVGMMKAIGATTRQIAALYLVQVSLLACAALAIGMPLGYLAGRAYAAFAGNMLNATIASNAVPAWAIVAQLAAGLLVPLAVAAGPVLHASRISVHAALANDAGGRAFGESPFDRLLARIAWLPRPLMLSLRTAFRRRGRLALTVATLAIGGGVFITTLDAAAAWKRVLADEGLARRYDLEVRLADPRPVADLTRTLAKVPEIAHAEYWSDASVRLPRVAPQRGVHVSVHGLDDEHAVLVRPRVPSPLLALPLLQGRWLRAGDRDAVVVNQALLARVPSLRLGDPLRLRVDDRDVALRVVGVVKELAPIPAAYTTEDPPPAESRSIRIVTRRHDLATRRAASRAIERLLPNVTSVQSLADSRQAFADHLVIINTALLLAAMLVVLVGALGLASTMALGVVERTRELGILSSLGATPRVLARDVVVQGVVIGALSWCVALAVAVPLTFFVNAFSGQIFIGASLPFVFSPAAAAAWLVLVLILSALASLQPARRASQLTIREALAYE